MSARMRRSVSRLGQKMPVWLEHFQRSSVFDGDHALLHVQEQTAAREAARLGGSWRKSYWMPTESDRCPPPAGAPRAWRLSGR